MDKDTIDTAFKHEGQRGLFIGEDKRGKQPPTNKTQPNIIEDVNSHIESFPTVSFHYSGESRQRKNAKLSINKMYE